MRNYRSAKTLLFIQFLALATFVVMPAISCTAESGLAHRTIAMSGQIAYPAPFQHMPDSSGPTLLDPLVNFALTVIGTVAGGLTLDYLRGRLRKWKDGKPKTPVVIYR